MKTSKTTFNLFGSREMLIKSREARREESEARCGRGPGPSDHPGRTTRDGSWARRLVAPVRSRSTFGSRHNAFTTDDDGTRPPHPEPTAPRWKLTPRSSAGGDTSCARCARWRPTRRSEPTEGNRHKAKESPRKLAVRRAPDGGHRRVPCGPAGRSGSRAGWWVAAPAMPNAVPDVGAGARGC